jgi:hypothetical protein
MMRSLQCLYCPAVLSRLADSSTYCRLLEDCLEVGTLADCQQIFAYMESAGVVEVGRVANVCTWADRCVRLQYNSNKLGDA